MQHLITIDKFFAMIPFCMQKYEKNLMNINIPGKKVQVLMW